MRRKMLAAVDESAA